MTQLELAPRPGLDLKDAIRAEVRDALRQHAFGRVRAITGDRLAEVVRERLTEGGRQLGVSDRTLLRRVQEAVQALIEAGEPIASNSSPPCGYFAAQTADELEESLAQCERRARMTLCRRRALRRVMAVLRGQQEIREVIA